MAMSAKQKAMSATRRVQSPISTSKVYLIDFTACLFVIFLEISSLKSSLDLSWNYYLSFSKPIFRQFISSSKWSPDFTKYLV